MELQLPDLNDSSLWKLVAIKTLSQPQKRQSIPSQEFTLEKYVCLVDSQCFVARDTWHLAGWAAMIVPGDSSRTLVTRRRLSLRETNLVVFPKMLATSFILQISFPVWLPSIRLIVKEYIGEDVRVFDQLDRIESKLEAY